MLSSLIIVMRESLEAVFIISLLLALSKIRGIGHRWIIPAISLGLVGAVAYSSGYDYLMEWFDGTGQERLAALVNTSIALLVILINMDLAIFHLRSSRQANNQEPNKGLVGTVEIAILYALCLALAMSMEAGEILIYWVEHHDLSKEISQLIYGSLLGLGIGFSAGYLTWALIIAGRSWQLRSAMILLMLVAAGLMSQSISRLAQAGIVDEGPRLFSVENLLPESSIGGQILYAMFSYESTPSYLQFEAYLATIFIASVTIGIVIYHFKGDSK